MFSVLTQTSKMYGTFTAVEKRIADVIIKQPENVVHMTVKEIATASQTSEAAIVRFSKRIGLKGIKVLKMELAKELHSIQTEKGSSKISIADSSKDIMGKVFHNSIQALHNTDKVIDIQFVEEAAQKILRAKKVVLFAVGESAVVTMDFKMKLQRIGIWAEQMNDQHNMMALLSQMTQQDILFIVSTSGRTKEITEVMKAARQQHIEQILITQNVNSPARKIADSVILMTEEENNIKVATMTARIVQLAIVDTLFLNICRLQGESSMKQIIARHDVMKERGEY